VLHAAAGRRGGFRRALLPALFEELEMPYVGSDPFVCALAADKCRTKHELAAVGVPTPRAAVLRDLGGIAHLSLAFPVILKPAFGDHSAGITQHAVVERPDELGARLADVLTRHRTGVLVEEYVDGRDVVVPFVQGASPETGGVLPPCEILYPATAGRLWPILDEDRRRRGYAALETRTPADLTVDQTTALRRLSRRIVEVLGLRDFGAIEFRVTDDGRVWFLEADTTPDLGPGAPIYRAAALAGLKSVDALLGAVVRGASERCRALR
jgi:D-alanine-D-alanine ligase